MTHDRMHEQVVKLSHEFMAVMLGVQRPTVSAVAGTLQHAGSHWLYAWAGHGAGPQGP